MRRAPAACVVQQAGVGAVRAAGSAGELESLSLLPMHPQLAAGRAGAPGAAGPAGHASTHVSLIGHPPVPARSLCRDELEHEERLARREDLLSAGSTDAELPAMVLRGETRLTQVGSLACGARRLWWASWRHVRHVSVQRRCLAHLPHHRLLQATANLATTIIGEQPGWLINKCMPLLHACGAGCVLCTAVQPAVSPALHLSTWEAWASWRRPRLCPPCGTRVG